MRPRWPEHPDSPDFSATEILGRLVRGTLIVLVLLGLALWGLRYWTKRNLGVAPPRGALTVIDSATLSGRCQLQLVEADGHRVLVGLDAGGVKCVTVLPDHFDEALLAAAEADDAASTPFEQHRSDRRTNTAALAVGQPA